MLFFIVCWYWSITCICQLWKCKHEPFISFNIFKSIESGYNICGTKSIPVFNEVQSTKCLKSKMYLNNKYIMVRTRIFMKKNRWPVMRCFENFTWGQLISEYSILIKKEWNANSAIFIFFQICSTAITNISFNRLVRFV